MINFSLCQNHEFELHVTKCPYEIDPFVEFNICIYILLLCIYIILCILFLKHHLTIFVLN